MKIFISSTSHDLEDFRILTIQELESRGHEVIYHESPTFPVKLRLSHSHDICLEAIKDVDLVICIIKSRYGGTYAGNDPNQFPDIDIRIKGKTKKGSDKRETITIPSKNLSITWCELYIAYQQKIDVITFVKNTTLEEKETRRRNQFLSSFQPAHVEDKKLFDLIDWIIKKRESNWIVKYNNILDYKEYLLKWIEEIEKSVYQPTNNSSNQNSLPKNIIIQNNNNSIGSIISKNNISPILTFVEGESDRNFIRYLIKQLNLTHEFRFIVTYGKYRMLQQSLDYVISYNADDILFIVDDDNNQDERKAFENMFEKIDIQNKKLVFAEPNLDEWIKIGLNDNYNQRQIKKIDYEIEFNLEKATSNSYSFKLLVDILKNIG